MCGRLQSRDPPCRSEMIFFLWSGESSRDRRGYVVLINSSVVSFCCLPLEQRSAVKRSCDHIYYLIVFPPKFQPTKPHDHSCKKKIIIIIITAVLCGRRWFDRWKVVVYIKSFHSLTIVTTLVIKWFYLIFKPPESLKPLKNKSWMFYSVAQRAQ